MGERDRREKLVNDFREAIRDSDLMDLGSNEYPSTWSNKIGLIDFYEIVIGEVASKKTQP